MLSKPYLEDTSGYHDTPGYNDTTGYQDTHGYQDLLMNSQNYRKTKADKVSRWKFQEQ